MSKIIDSLVQASIDGKNFAGVLLCKLNFDSPTGELRYSNAYQSIYWDEAGSGEETYEGLGNWANISTLNESSELAAQTIQVSLSGIPNELLSDAFSTEYVGNPIYIWYATLDKETYAVEGGQDGPVLIFAGRMDFATIEFGDTATITINATSRLADWDRPRGGRYNKSYQQTYIDDNDTGFNYVKGLQNKVVQWGAFTILDPSDRDTGTDSRGGHCFTSDTKITMLDGSLKDIRDIVVGDLLLGPDGEGQKVLRKSTFKHQGEIYAINNDNYFVTSSHPFKTVEGWKAFDDGAAKVFNPDLNINILAERDILITESGEEKIDFIRTVYFDDINVHSITVDNSKEYYANGFLVHNK